MKRLLAPAALVIVSLALSLVAGEFVIRLLYKDQTVLYPRYHTDYHYGSYVLRGLRANAQFRHTSVDGSWKFVTNSKGLRNDRDFPYAKPAGTLRVLSLGDSQTQGYEVRQEDTFSAVLERYLTSHRIRAEVLNAGVSGFSTAEELAYLENEGYRYHPDVVVLAFYANDFEDNLKAGLFDVQQGKLVARSHEHIPGVRIQNIIYGIPGVTWLSENSYFYSLLFNNVWEFFKAALLERAIRHAAAGESPAPRDDREYAVSTTSGVSEHEMMLAQRLIERMQRFCSEHGIRLIVVDIPRDKGPYRIAESVPASLEEALSAEQIEVVSSTALLGGFDGVAEMHVPHGDNHISEFTHTMIGAELGRRIVQGAQHP
jgi:lysophospholipase L1-like esterase